MKIAIDISQIVYHGTGVATYTEELIKSLLQIDNDNEYILYGTSFRQSTVLNQFYLNLKKNHSNLEAKFFPIPSSVSNFFWNSYHRLAIETLIGDIDLYHSSDWVQPPVKGKAVTTIHDLVVYRYPESSHPNIVKTHKKRLDWVKEECDAVIADSKATKEDIQTFLSIDESKINVIYPGITNNFKSQPSSEIERVRKAYRLFDNYILCVGTIEPRKNIKNAIAAFERYSNHPLIKTTKQPIELVIVGHSGWGEKPKTKANVRYLGQVTDINLPALYAGARIFLNTSLYEGFGFPILEAMACGCPVITSFRGSLGEIATNSALEINPESIDDIAIKMTKLSIDSKIRNELIEKGLKQIRNFKWESTAKNTLSLYQKIVS